MRCVRARVEREGPGGGARCARANLLVPVRGGGGGGVRTRAQKAATHAATAAAAGTQRGQALVLMTRKRTRAPHPAGTVRVGGKGLLSRRILSPRGRDRVRAARRPG